ncbi:MAG: mucoidy inhibitor MuiA family protein, partial [Planctomycetota bacterium]
MHRVFMSGVILSSLLLLAAGNRAAAEEPLAVDSRISSATIYSSQARVERALAVPPGKGVVRLQVGPLPATLLDDSVRVEGDPHLRVLSVEVSRASGADRASPEFLRLEADRRAREEELADLQRRAGAALERMRRFRDLEVGSPPRSATEPSVPPISTESWGSYLELARRGMEDAWQAARAHESRVRELGKEMAVIRKRMAELEVPSRRRSAAALIQVQNMTGEGGTLRLSYGIPLAFWYPEYSVEIDPVSGTAELSLFGVVHQRTGEDWPEIPIHFSTSIPESGAGLGELTSVRIERRRFAEATDEDLGLALGLDAAPKRARGRPAARKSVPRAPPPEDTAASHRDLSAQAYAGTHGEDGDEAWSEESRRRRKK